MPNFKRIGGGPWKNGQKSDDLTWNDPFACVLYFLRINALSKHATCLVPQARDTTAQNGVPPTLGAGAEDVDWNQFVNEIRRLYRQLEQTMKNNNLLRAKLDERLAQGGASVAGSRTSIGPVEGQQTDTDFTRDAGKL